MVLLKPQNPKAEKPVDAYCIVSKRNVVKEFHVLKNPAIDFVKYTQIRSLHFIRNIHFSKKSKTVLKLKQNYVIEVECKSTDECTLLKIKRATERAISKSNI